MIKIVGKFLVELRDMLKEKKVTVTITDEAIDYLVDVGFDKKMGARPLQRTIDKEPKRDLSKILLFGELKNGGLVNIDAQDKQLTLERKNKQKPRSINR